jgi:hypothetical protein
MTTEDLSDVHWLAALAGQADPAADKAGNLQALALRRALQARRQQFEQDLPQADAALFQQLQFRLRREGLMKPPLWQQLPVWGLAASLLLGVSVLLQQGGWLGAGDADRLRGGSDRATMLLVNDPEARLVELLAGLRAVGASPQVERQAGGRIKLQMAGDPAVLDYLASQRIEPQLVNGQVSLILSPPSAKAPGK